MVLLMSMSVSALVKYGGTPQPPYLVFGHVSWNDQLLMGARLEIINQNTRYTKQITTDNHGYWQEETGNWLTIAAGRPPVQYGDVIIIKVLDGCGVGDTCSKSITVMSEGNEYKAEIDFDITGELQCPPISCPSCSCSGGGGGSYTCPTTTCTEEDCVEAKACPEQIICPEPVTCPEETVCDEPVCPEQDDNGILAYLTGLIGIIAGGVGTYYFKRKDAKFPNGTFVKFGGVGPKHLHRGIKGYHDPDTSHREAHEKHPKGELDPKYEKDENGVYRYVE